MVDCNSDNPIYKFNDESNQSNNTVNSESESNQAANRSLIKCTCIQEDQVKLESVNAFKIDFTLLSVQMKPITRIHVGEPFLLLCDLKNETPFSLRFKNSFIETNEKVKFKVNADSQSFLKGETLKPMETATECFCLMVEDDSETELLNNTKVLSSLGTYFIEWKRKVSSTIYEGTKSTEESNNTNNENDDFSEDEAPNEKEEFTINTKITLPEVSYELFPFMIEPKIPTHGYLDKQLDITYSVKNKTKSQILDAEIMIDENEYFAISGGKLKLMQIMPNDSANYTFVIYPLQSGYCKLPNLHLKLNNFNFKKVENLPETTVKMNQSQIANTPSPDSSNSQEFLDSIIQNMIPSGVYIFPNEIDKKFLEN